MPTKSNIKFSKVISSILTTSLITMLFLKWFGLADFSYWVVLSPLWGSIVIFFVLLIFGIIAGAIAYHYRKWRAKNKK